MISTIVYILVAEIWNTAGQVCFKKSANVLKHEGQGSYPTFLKRVVKHPGIAIGLLFMTFGLVFWIMALSTAPLSLVFPLGSVQYILILLTSHFLLFEKIDGMRITGTLFIAVGITLIALTN